eukprot:CAMPEP_0194259670 /NCGR_PEP_ID=MMETSP0158-20130606/44147_1 /TAXON_ID=33649 /ORGANISM="Thalassionema nitzschioides, Strain L26-B" /LENGTH=226 /DNA_ID=CAMNT_0038999565 /DNA_START=56 /DNA_END=732 /DNA_ORIENTATION=-
MNNQYFHNVLSCIQLSVMIATVFTFAGFVLDLKPLEMITLPSASTTSDGTGLHLLTCPTIFEKYEGKTGIAGKIEGIQLNQDSAEKLLAMVRESMNHAHVAQTDEKNVPWYQRPMSGYLAKEIRDITTESTSGVNIHRNDNDSKSVCKFLESIIEEQIEKESYAPNNNDESYYATISMAKFSGDHNNWRFLRGARSSISEIPIVNKVVVRMATLPFRDELHGVLGT